MSWKCSVRPSRPAALFPFPGLCWYRAEGEVMPRIAEQALPVTGGVDTHADVHVAAVVDQVGRVLGTQAFPATAAGYRAALAWMSAHGELAKVGVEGTGSYGAGLARCLAACGVEVVEVMRPNRQARRRRGKSDAADAVAAALAALSGEASGVPKSRDGAAESIRALRVARAGAVKARTQAGNQLRDLIVTAPEQAAPAAGRAAPPAAGGRGGPVPPAGPGRAGRGRQGCDGQRGSPPPGTGRRDRPARCRARRTPQPHRPGGIPGQAGRGHRCRRHAAGHHRRQPRPGPHRGKLRRAVRRQPRGRLLRQATAPPAQPRRRPAGQLRAVDVAMTRLACDPRTKAYAARRTTEGKTKKEIIRCLKRYIAREMYKTLCRPSDQADRPCHTPNKIFRLRP